MRALVLAFLVAGGTAHAAEVPRFVAESGGVDHTYTGGLHFMAGAGVAVFDCNGDDLPELFLAGGEDTASFWRNTSEPGGPLDFERAAVPELNLRGATGAYPLDIDGDGRTDLAILRVGENLLMRGQGDCRFTRANEAWRFDGGDAWTTAFSAVWEAGNAWPTLAFGNFMQRETIVLGYGDCDSNALYRPRPGGGYGEVTLLDPGHCALSMLASDWNRDGVPDLRVSNDREYFRDGGEQLWTLPPDKAPHLATEAEGWRPVEIYGMGIASHDVSGDGRPDYFLTNMANNRLEVGTGDGPIFEDRAGPMGVASGSPFAGGDDRPSTAWHAEFDDVNNDGRADLLVVKGNVDLITEFADADPNNLLLRQDDGTFAEGAETAGILSFERGRGGALVDLNTDGLLDLIVTNRFAPAELWRNTGAGTATAPAPLGNWLALRLAAPTGNRDGIGSWIEVRTESGIQRREITVGGGHAGGGLGWVHFGLGSASSADVRVQWEGRGDWSSWQSVDANRRAVFGQDDMVR